MGLVWFSHVFLWIFSSHFEPSDLALMQMTPGALLLIAGGSVAVAKDLIFYLKLQEELPVEDAVDDCLYIYIYIHMYMMFFRLNHLTFI